MKGSNKRHNLVCMFSILLVGIRSDLSDKFSVDILFVYENHHIQTLSLNSQFPSCLLSYSIGIANIDKKEEDNNDDIFLSYDNNNNNNISESESKSESKSKFILDSEIKISEIDFNLI